MIKLKTGVRDYLSYFENRKIRENDRYILTTADGLRFYVNTDTTLTWADVSTEEELRRRGLDGDLYNIAPERILSRKKWSIKKR